MRLKYLWNLKGVVSAEDGGCGPARSLNGKWGARCGANIISLIVRHEDMPQIRVYSGEKADTGPPASVLTHKFRKAIRRLARKRRAGGFIF